MHACAAQQYRHLLWQQQRQQDHLEDLLEVGVEGGKAVVGRGRAAEEQAHRVALVPKGGLHADEHLAKLLAKH